MKPFSLTFPEADADMDDLNRKAIDEMLTWKPLLERLVFLHHELQEIEEPDVFAVYLDMLEQAEIECDRAMNIKREKSFRQRVRDGHGDLAQIRDKAIQFGLV